MKEDENEYITDDGHKNWPLIRRHVYLIENFCKKKFGGKIPLKHKLSDILSSALQEKEAIPTASLKQVKSRGNPAKKVLEPCGIEFPAAATNTSDTKKIIALPMCSRQRRGRERTAPNGS